MRFLLGVNYWPIGSAMYWWKLFDAEEVKRDFERIRQVGFDLVRIFLLWEDFQPSADRVSEGSLANLIAVAEAASRNNLSLILTLFTGHMSGANWIPQWALGPAVDAPPRFRVISCGKVTERAIRNWYAEEDLARAQALLARQVASALRGHKAVWAWDLGNESSNCVVPPSREAAIRWLELIAGEIRAVDPSRPITIGLHAEDLEEDRYLGPQEAARVCDFLCMHGYPIYSDWADGPTDALMLPFLGLIARWLGGKDVLFEEFGAPTVSAPAIAASSVPLLSEEAGALFARRALAALHRFGFMGALWWCYGDYAEPLWDRPPLDEAAHERHFGLWRSDYSEKPALLEMKRMSKLKRLRPPDDLDWIDIRPDEFSKARCENLRRLYSRFRSRYAAQPDS